MKSQEKFKIMNYHKNRTICDDKFIINVFNADRMDAVRTMQDRYPNSIIRMTNGLAGSVPANCNGSIITIYGI